MKNINLILRETLKKKFKGLEVDTNTILQCENSSLPEKERHKVVKVLMLCMLGEFFGYHTLKEILLSRFIKSTKLYDVFNMLSFKDLTNISAELFVYFVKNELIKLGKQHSSSWSRANITIVIDSSIYKQWLTDRDNDFFTKFYSGQTGKVEYGYRLTVGGIVVKETFYPLVFYIATKSFTDSEVAQVILPQIIQVIDNLADENNLTFGQLYLSIDNGFNEIDLIELSEKYKVILICVPKKNHFFVIDDQELKLSQYIEKEFIQAETDYYKNNPNNEEPFYLRIKAFYRSKDIEVVLLFFRLNGSNKISVIYSTNLDIKAKTLRRHWFQRTLIEQFFRFSKHTLHFAQSHSKNADEFIENICVNFLKVSICLSMRNQMRKHKNCKKITFGTIRLLVSTYRVGEENLISLLNIA